MAEFGYRLRDGSAFRRYIVKRVDIPPGVQASLLSGGYRYHAGEAGKRFALPHSRILMHQPSGQAQGQAADNCHPGGADHLPEAHDGRADRFQHRPPRRANRADSDWDRWFTADEAEDYRFIDQVIAKAVHVAEPAPCRGGRLAVSGSRRRASTEAARQAD